MGIDSLFSSRILVQSWCPAIYGHEMVKAGLVLGFFGGRTKFKENRNCIPIRGDIHVLMVGDPGLGTHHYPLRTLSSGIILLSIWPEHIGVRILCSI